MGTIAKLIGYAVMLFVALVVLVSIFSNQNRTEPVIRSVTQQSTPRPADINPSPTPQALSNPSTDNPSATTTPTLSEEETARLLSQRRYDIDLIAATKRLLDLPPSDGFQRSLIYCSFTSEQAQLLVRPREQPTTDLDYIQQCQTRLVWRMEQMPTDERFRENARKAQEQIEEIDRELKAGHVNPDSQLP